MLRIVLFVLASQMVHAPLARGEDAPKDPLDLILAEEARQPEKAIDDYSDFIIAHSPPLTEAETVEVAIAFFNRGIVLTRLGRTAAAKRSYQALEDGFAKSGIGFVRLQVAKGLVNLAFLNLEDGNYQAAVTFAQTVDKRYSGANDGALGDDGFDLQVLKALNDKADAYSRFGAPTAAKSTCDEIFKRFKSAQGEKIKLALDVSFDICRHISTVPYAFERTPVEPAPTAQTPSNK